MLPYLSLHVGVPEGEEEPLAVVGPQAVDAPGVDGPAQVVVDLLLRVPLFLVPAWADSEPEKESFPSSIFLLIQSHSGWGPFQFIYDLAALFKVVGRYFQSSEGSVVQEKFEASCQKSFGLLSGPFTDKGLFILALGKRLIQSWPM